VHPRAIHASASRSVLVTTAPNLQEESLATLKGKTQSVSQGIDFVPFAYGSTGKQWKSVAWVPPVAVVPLEVEAAEAAGKGYSHFWGDRRLHSWDRTDHGVLEHSHHRAWAD